MSTNENELTNQAATTPAVTEATPTPAITEETGQLDTRFALWRGFCIEAGVDVETLPSELDGDLKERWEAMKETELPTVREEATNKPVTTQT